MKFKRFTYLLGTLLLAASSANAVNVAEGKEGHASEGNAAVALDENTGTRWETSTNDNQWIYVDLGQVTNIDRVSIDWETAYAKHYKIHVANVLTEEMSTNLDNDDPTTRFATGWTTIAEINKTVTVVNQHYKETITPSEAVSARYVAIECIERATQWGFSIWEFGVYDTPDLPPLLNRITITPDKTEGSITDTYTFGIQYIDQYKDAYTLTAEENASREWIVSEGVTMDDNRMTVTKRGTYTVQMKINDVLSNVATIKVLAEGTNLALGKPIVYATEGSQNPENAVDGKDTMWITDEPDWAEDYEYDAVLVVDLGDTYDINCVHTWFEGASSADYTVTFSLDNVTYDPALPEFTVTSGAGMTNRHDWLTYDAGVKARYVKFHSTRGATSYGTKLREIEVYSNSKAALNSIAVTADKECWTPGEFTLTATGLDQFGEPFDISADNGIWTASEGTMNGNVLTASEAGTYEVSYTSETGIHSNTVKIEVVDPKGDNLAVGRPVTVSEEEKTADSTDNGAVDGIDDNQHLLGFANSADATDYEYTCWMIVELDKVYKIHAVKASWEGANSCRYTIETSLDGNTFTPMGEYDKPAKQEFRVDWFAGKGVEAKYVKLTSTKASTQYGTKLQELYVYDVDGTTSSVASIAAEGAIFVAGDEVVLPEGTVEATVYSVNGAAMARVEGETSMNVANLQKGVYVVKAVKADGTVVAAKIVK